MAKALTAQSINRLKHNAERRVEVPDGLLPGLYFVMQPTGSRSWAVRYRHAGKPRKHTVGSYPAVDLAGARAAAREALRAVALGRDPAAEKQAARRALAEPYRDKFERVVAEFLDRHVRKNNKPRTAEETERIFRRHVVPVWGERRIQEITRRDVIELLDGIVDRGTPIAANRTLAAVRTLFNWAVDRSVVDATPCARITPPTTEKSRDRVLTDNEIRLAWLAAEKVGYPFGSLVQLLMLTGQRRDEVAKARRTELKGGGALWTIPAERTKNGVEHDVPLSAPAQEIITRLPRIGRSALLFTTNGEAAFSGYSKGKARLNTTMLLFAQREAAERGEEPNEVTVDPWRLHDLRRTLASGSARLGFPVHVIEAVLNHTAGEISGVAKVYNRHKYLDEKRRALDGWAEHVMQIVSVSGNTRLP